MPDTVAVVLDEGVSVVLPVADLVIDTERVTVTDTLVVGVTLGDAVLVCDPVLVGEPE